MTPRETLQTFVLDLPGIARREDMVLIGHDHCFDEGKGDSLLDSLTITVAPVRGGLEVQYGVRLVPVERNGQLAIEVKPFGSHPDPQLRTALRSLE
jgi:hypothetical protein